MKDVALEALRKSSIFRDLRDDDLESLVCSAERLSVEPGACLIEEGDTGNSLMVILSGEVEVVRNTGDGEAGLARFGQGEYVGEMALINDGPRTATVRAISPTEVLVITKSEFEHLLHTSPKVCIDLVRTVLNRLKSTEAMLLNQEKMAALGRVSAGLAHELNNPAAAMKRSAQQVEYLIGNWQSSVFELGPYIAEPSTRARLDQMRQSFAVPRATGMAQSNPLDRADREETLIAWFEDHGVIDPYDTAEALAGAGWTATDLDAALAEIDQRYVPVVAQWLSHTVGLNAMLGEISMSAGRLSEIVDAIKRYSHMDRAPVDRLNVNQGIESTLVILRHKMKDINLTLDLAPDLPEIEGYPAELNQVWTNLIDNAIDAVGGKGELAIRSWAEDEHVVVTLTDSGAGIPEDYLARIFEPFFTTKDVGVGTGLGLHIVHRIVVHRHAGNIDVTSKPGETTFRVELPRTGNST